MPTDVSGATLSSLRRLLLGLLLLGLVGTAAELVLMGHDEDAWQLIPLVVIAMAVLASGALLWGQTGVRRGQTGVRPGSDPARPELDRAILPGVDAAAGPERRFGSGTSLPG